MPSTADEGGNVRGRMWNGRWRVGHNLLASLVNTTLGRWRGLKGVDPPSHKDVALPGLLQVSARYYKDFISLHLFTISFY